MSPTAAHYPVPLAYSYRLVETEFETFRILKELYRNAEGLTAFLGSLALALAPAPTGQAKKPLLKAWGGKGATFGDWFYTLDRTVSIIDENNGPLHYAVKQLFGTKERPTPFREGVRRLMGRRNELHHSSLPVGKKAEELVQEVRAQFEHCVEEARYVWQHPLRLVLDYDAIRGSESVLTTSLDYSGDHPASRKVQEEYRGLLKKQDLYILQNGKE